MHVGGLLVFSGGERAGDRFRALRAAPVRSEPFDLRLRRALIPGRTPSWDKLPVVDTEEHVRRVTLPPDGGDAAIMSEISRIHTAPLDRTRPMWDCHFLDGLDDDRYAYYYRVHHSCIDGISAIKRMQDGLSQSADEVTDPLWAYVPDKRRRRPRPGANPVARVAAAIRSNAQVVAEITAALRDQARPHHAPTTRASRPFTAPQSILNHPTASGHRGVGWARLPLSGVKEIGKAAGATVNEVLLTIFSGVLRDELLARNALPDQPLVAMVPMSLRDVADDSAVANRLTALLCNLATHMEDPLARLRAVVESSQDGKRILRNMSADAAAAYVLVVMFPAITAMRLGVFNSRFPLPFNVVISNVPGPREPRYDHGARLEAIYPISLLYDRQSINFTIISYMDDLDIGLVATREGIPDTPALASDIRGQFDTLHRAILG
jgi:diacylglycerol O-acyltransferase